MKPRPPRGIHPAIAAVPDWEKKLVWPDWTRTRLYRNCKRRKLSAARRLPVQDLVWPSTHGGPGWNPETKFHRPGEGNEFWKNPELLRYVNP